MAIKLKLRGPDGKYVKGNVKHLEKSLTKFGSKVIKEGRRILNQKKKRTQDNTLFNDYHYKMKSSSSTITFGFEFGGAEDYWEFVDQGVIGTGGAKKGRTAKGEQSARGGTGVARGAGSPFKFKYDNPKGDLVKAIRGWIKNKPVSLGDMNITGLAFAIGYSIKRRGLERTMFYSNPVNKALKKLPDELTEAFRLDVEKLVGRLPSKIKAVDKNLQT
jgi:hypothetical protein|tara:strand:+ start:247 stop:897 length:651 start_codon:yes stop_codon:yes gene_type:complete